MGGECCFLLVVVVVGILVGLVNFSRLFESNERIRLIDEVARLLAVASAELVDAVVVACWFAQTMGSARFLVVVVVVGIMLVTMAISFWSFILLGSYDDVGGGLLLNNSDDESMLPLRPHKLSGFELELLLLIPFVVIDPLDVVELGAGVVVGVVVLSKFELVVVSLLK